jgi:HK97 family phage prohead protease
MDHLIEHERRVFPSLFEVRASKDPYDDSMHVSGYAARYGILSHKIPGGQDSVFRERILPGAFDRVLRTDPDVVATMNHNANFVLGRTTADTLTLRSDKKGLAFSCELPNTSYARDLFESVKRGDMNGCSYAFSLERSDADWQEEEDEEDRSRIAVRNIRNFSSLMDVSIVTTPAYPGTSVDARNLVSAEVRSYLQALKPKKTNPRGESYGTFAARRDAEKAAETVLARRRNLFNFVAGL